ncbi:Hypothetical protein NTJ_08227 [Nesidiocoris tenuis]|uniref:Uncharacterized protein n=1 Tax=Nesidiocoris tenuis TaxID=355587 RepID=A0ABN7ATP9_9HEMI|nr:Hypothetical protein NTJ_08227 [Nesidiocoris tenuis]
MISIRVLFFVALAITCVFAAEERVKKQVLVGASPYAYSAYPYAYSAAAIPAAYPYAAYSGFSGYYY